MKTRISEDERDHVYRVTSMDGLQDQLVEPNCDISHFQFDQRAMAL